MPRSCAAVSAVARRAAHAAVSPSKLARNSRSSLARRAADVDERRERGADGVAARLRDERAAALADADLQRAEDLHRAQGLPQRRPADAEQLGQVALGRQALAGLEVAVGDRRLELADDDVEGPLPPHGGERLAARLGRHAPTSRRGSARRPSRWLWTPAIACAQRRGVEVVGLRERDEPVLRVAVDDDEAPLLVLDHAERAVDRGGGLHADRTRRVGRRTATLPPSSTSTA